MDNQQNIDPTNVESRRIPSGLRLLPEYSDPLHHRVIYWDTEKDQFYETYVLRRKSEDTYDVLDDKEIQLSESTYGRVWYLVKSSFFPESPDQVIHSHTDNADAIPVGGPNDIQPNADVARPAFRFPTGFTVQVNYEDPLYRQIGRAHV